MKKVLITREESQFYQVKDTFSKYGLEAMPFPVIKFEGVDFEFNKDYFDYLIFTSSNGVEFFHKKYCAKDKKVIAVGEKTAKSLSELGYTDIIIPSKQSAEGILEYILENKETFYGKRLALIRAVEGVDTLIKYKPEYTEIVLVAVYRTVINVPQNIEKTKAMLKNGEIDFVVFSSPSTIENFLKIFHNDADILKNTNICVMGKTTLKKAQEKGIKATIVLEKPSFDNMAKEISKYI